MKNQIFLNIWCLKMQIIIKLFLESDDCLLRAQMDSEAAASLLDLSKSRHPPSLQGIC